MVVNRGGRGDKVEAKLTLEAFLHDLHVEKAQESHAKAKAQGHARLGSPDERGVVHLELLERVAQVLVLLVVDGKKPREDHGLCLVVARTGLLAGTVLVGDGVARLHEGGVLEARHHIAHLAHAKLVQRGLEGALAAHAVAEEGIAKRHHAQVVALLDAAIKDTNRGHNAAVLVEI